MFSVENRKHQMFKLTYFNVGSFWICNNIWKKINKKGQKKLEKQVVLKINSWHILQLIRLIGKKERLRKGESAKLSIYKLWKNFWKTFLKVNTFYYMSGIKIFRESGKINIEWLSTCTIPTWKSLHGIRNTVHWAMHKCMLKPYHGKKKNPYFSTI